jgi:hypothetical protein
MTITWTVIGAHPSAQRSTAPPFTLTVEHKQGGHVRTFEDDRSVVDSSGELILESQGKEAASCGDGPTKPGRASSRSSASVEGVTSDSVTFALSTLAQSVGGIRTICARCLGTTCLLPEPQSSDADARSTSDVRVEIQFDQQAEASRYSISIRTVESTLYGATVTYRLDDESGENLMEGRSLPTTFGIMPSRNKRYVFRMNLESYAASRATLRNASGFVRVEINVRPSPILSADNMPATFGADPIGRPVGSESTAGLVFLRGSAHCAATLIARQTAITTAGCVRRLSYDDQTNLRLVPAATASFAEVRSLAFLREERPPVLPRLAADDDIAILRLQEPGGWRGVVVRTNAVRLKDHGGTLATVEGFVEDRSAIKPDRASLLVAAIEDTTFTLRPAKGRCNFTAGAGVFINENTRRELVGLITRAEVTGECRATRLDLDLFRKWIAGKSR